MAEDFETSLREYLQLGKSARLTPRSAAALLYLYGLR